MIISVEIDQLVVYKLLINSYIKGVGDITIKNDYNQPNLKIPKEIYNLANLTFIYFHNVNRIDGRIINLRKLNKIQLFNINGNVMLHSNVMFLPELDSFYMVCEKLGIKADKKDVNFMEKIKFAITELM